MTVAWVLDTNVLGELCHPNRDESASAVEWMKSKLNSEEDELICIPAIADYELRREYCHRLKDDQSPVTAKSVDRLDNLIDQLDYLELSTESLRKAAEFWGQSRASGNPTASKAALDGDAILAAQVVDLDHDARVVTTNVGHLSVWLDKENILDPSQQWASRD
jgi:predicted nucleic acid-binding protein